MARTRLVSIDAIKGIGIFLVVLGHIVARDMPVGDTWFYLVKSTIYRFHMPLFMFITGLIYGYGRKPILTLADYWRHVNQKTKRLVPAWVLFAFIVFFGKYMAGQFFYVDNPIREFSDFFMVLTAPSASYASFLWYIYAIYMLTSGRILFFLPIAFLLYFAPRTAAFCNDLLMEYAFAFFLGVFCGDNYSLFNGIVRRFGPLFMALFLLAIPFAVTRDIPKLLMGLLAIGGISWLAEFSVVKNSRQLQMFATYTFSIYLMNTMCIGLVKAGFLRFLSWDSTGFLIMGPFMLLAGLYLPILVRKQFISRSRFLSYIVA